MPTFDKAADEPPNAACRSTRRQAVAYACSSFQRMIFSAIAGIAVVLERV
jgi:hypothetical protein